MKSSRNILLTLQSLSKNSISPSIKKEEAVSEGCTLPVNMITGLFLSLNSK